MGILLQTHWIVVVMDQFSRRIIGFGVQATTVDGVGLCRMFATKNCIVSTGQDNLPVRVAILGNKTRRVLVVDDEPTMCDVIRMVLEPDQYEVESAVSGQEALNAIQKGKFDLIIVDYKMPGMTGDKLAAAIKAIAPEQLIIMMTGHQEALRFAGDFPLTVDLVINKPFTVPEFREAVRQLASKT